MQEQFDIIHDHNSQNNPVSLPLANLSKTPVVMTLHGPMNNGYNKAFEFFKKPYLVTISKKQKVPAQQLNYIGNVYHGLHMADYPFSRDHDGYLLFVGRIEFRHGIDEKGLNHAIEIAERIKMPLIIAAKLDPYFPADIEYFKQYIKPRLSDNIRWIGEVDENKRNKLMSRAYCYLHPVNFPEPFGLTLIEAMATGCPVIAFANGSIPEILQDGMTGYVVETVDDAIGAIKMIPAIDRGYCRKYSLERFSAERMAQDYEKIYAKAVELRSLRSVTKKYDTTLQARQVSTLQKLTNKTAITRH
jgi:glycosyltransferase involved in cell wall biosynthesis